MYKTNENNKVCTNSSNLPPCAKPGQFCTKHDLERLAPKHQHFSIDGDLGCKYGEFSFDGDYVCHARKNKI